MMLFSIIIVSYNKPHQLKDTLSSLIKNIEDAHYEIIVVDNASSANNVEIVKNNFPEVKLIINSDNTGFAGGSNLGAKNAIGKYLLFVNSDVIISGDPVKNMIDVFNQNRDIGIVGCQLINPDGSLQPSHFRFPSLKMRFLQLSGLKFLFKRISRPILLVKKKYLEVDYVSGAFLMISKETFDSHGGFDEHYFMYHEDADLAYQVRKKGLKSILLNTRYVIHLAQNHEYLNSNFVLFHLNKGQLIFYKKNYSHRRVKLLCILSIFFFSLKYFIYFFKRNEKNNIKAVVKLYSSELTKY